MFSTQDTASSSFARSNAPILFDHSEQSDITGYSGQRGRLRVQLFAFSKIAASLGDDREAIEAVRLAADRSALFRVYQALGVAAIGGLGFTLLTMERPLPPEGVRQKGEVLFSLKCFDRIVVKPERFCGIASSLSLAGEVDQTAHVSGIRSRHSRDLIVEPFIIVDLAGAQCKR